MNSNDIQVPDSEWELMQQHARTGGWTLPKAPSTLTEGR